MRRIIAIVLALLLCGVALADGVPGNRLGYKVLAELSGGEQNAFVSPVSLAWALSMAADGATGETRSKLLGALDAENTDDIVALAAPLKEAGIRWGNAAFVSDRLAVLPDFGARLAEAYEAERFPLTGAEGVSDWVKQKTDGLIEDIPLALDESAVLVLANAVAMDAEWASPFEAGDTWEDDFHAPEGDVKVRFMHQLTYAQYGENMGCQLACKAYMNGGLALMIALPPEGGLKRALKNLAENPNSFFTFKPMPQNVALSLPKLDISTEASLKDAIVAAGCWVPFNAEYADYSGISEEPLVISDVLQQVRFQLDEEGTRAAAATEVVMVDGAAPPDESAPEPIPFNCDRPFIVAVVDRTTGVILFAGAVVNPVNQ